MARNSNSETVLRDSIRSTQMVVFAHHIQDGEETDTQYSISVSRRYRDGNEQWKRTEYLRPQDVGPAIALLLQAQSFLLSRKVIEQFPHDDLKQSQS